MWLSRPRFTIVYVYNVYLIGPFCTMNIVWCVMRLWQWLTALGAVVGSICIVASIALVAVYRTRVRKSRGAAADLAWEFWWHSCVLVCLSYLARVTFCFIMFWGSFLNKLTHNTLFYFFNAAIIWNCIYWNIFAVFPVFQRVWANLITTTSNAGGILYLNQDHCECAWITPNWACIIQWYMFASQFFCILYIVNIN